MTGRAGEGEQLVRCWFLWLEYAVRWALGGLLEVPTGADPFGATVGTKTDYLLVDITPKGA